MDPELQPCEEIQPRRALRRPVQSLWEWRDEEAVWEFSSGTKRKPLQACKQWQVQQNNWRTFFLNTVFRRIRLPVVLWQTGGFFTRPGEWKRFRRKSEHNPEPVLVMFRRIWCLSYLRPGVDIHFRLTAKRIVEFLRSLAIDGDLSRPGWPLGGPQQRSATLRKEKMTI